MRARYMGCVLVGAMTTKEHRKAIPLGVKLHACLLLLGFSDEDIAAGIDFDHQPALGLREIRNGEMIPDPNDPHFLRPMRKADHLIKTAGRKNITTAGSDIHAIAKVKRINGTTPKKPKKKWASRPFPKRKT